ncbi:MAG TPA: carbamoyltransferase HypF, partial [Acidimicrobiales bacterium]|nr:carbamoyltransferase HypF [Acidimicrobiales bacterium]
VGATRFRIIESSDSGAPSVSVSVDTATCPSCLAEVDDPADRRYRYPFANCTDCGPRYTIVVSIPYDRGATTMAGFPMCEACQSEYDDPLDRRFHAQPNACARCGPRVTYRDRAGRPLAEGDAALDAAVAALVRGKVLAIKGIGGYHLAADATNVRAVTEIRHRKGRNDKPFAVMVANLEAARRACHFDDSGLAALSSHRRPIVLGRRRAGTTIAAETAPGLAELGVMLPYSPLHHLLISGVGRPLVMTSGNVSDDPIAHVDDDAIERLGTMVDGFLSHDRPIHIRCDDSVVRSAGGRVQMVRRARGYAPEPLALPGRARRQVLAVGAGLKSTISVAKDRQLATSHHIGDLGHLAAYRSFLQAVRHLPDLFGVEPGVVAHDLHLGYLSTKWALDSDLEPWPVQHHHAHVASCMVEHGRGDPVLGVAFDGLGLGPDGTMWGGEFLIADLAGFERVGHLRTVALPGGEAAVVEPWRMALSWACAAIGREGAAEVGARLDSRFEVVLALVESARHAPLTSSVGRLFDAVAALIGVRSRVTYEGQAAIELEALAAGVDDERAPSYPLEVVEHEGMVVLDPAPMLAAVIDDVAHSVAPATIAAGFHRGLGAATADVVARLALVHDLDTVALSGGVFQNARLSDLVAGALRSEGLAVLVHEAIPPNDGGISVGQAAIGALAPGTTPA